MKKSLLGSAQASAVLTSLFMLGACANTYSAEAPSTSEGNSLPVFSQERIKADLEFLADDALEGRDTGSRGYRIAANYVAATFKQLGLKPGGEDGTYFQEVPFQKAKLDIESAKISIRNADGETVLTAGDDFFVGGSVKSPSGEAAWRANHAD